MSKTSKFIVLDQSIPEWGVTPSVSTAVPIAASGAEIKSTKDVSNGMYVVLRAKVKNDAKLLCEVKKVITEAKQSQPKQTHYSGTFFKSRTRAPRPPAAFMARRGR